MDGGKSIIIERNIVRNGQRGFQIGCENQSFLTYAKADSVVLRNNIAYGNSRGGIGLGTINHPANPAKVTNSWVLNNTCYNNYVSQIEFGKKEDFGELNLDFSEHCAVRNNIFASSIAGRDRLMNSYPSTPPVNLNIDYNFWYEATNATPYFVYANAAYVGFVHYKNSLGKDVNGRFETPSFYNVSNKFRLGVSSLANEAGDNTPFWLTATGATDFDFKPRLKGIRTEPGAYEQHCINGQVISQNIASGPQKFESNTTITISSKISANTQVELDAGQSITIQPGFEAPKTSTFKAYIDGCGNK
ncbi:MAG: hypothetical protein R2822_11950 [Spirosomataceae bacterium]